MISQQKILVIDSTYLCHRAFFAISGPRGFGAGLEHEGLETSIPFIFFKDIYGIVQWTNPDCMAFCFDAGKSLRYKIYKEYKANREKSLDIKEGLGRMKVQIERLAYEYLPRLGFRNILSSNGFEGDDLIASSFLSNRKPKYREFVIVSNDEDMLQLIRKDCSVYNMKRVIDLEIFKREYGIPPFKWSTVKAIAGCSSDNIKGVSGVGEKTALKFIKGEKISPSKKELIEDFTKSKNFKLNRRLVKLPFKRTPEIKLKKDKVSIAAWRGLCDELRMDSIVEMPPFDIRKFRKNRNG